MIALECRRRLAAGWTEWLSHLDVRVPVDVALVAINGHIAGKDAGEMERWGAEWAWRVTPTGEEQRESA